MSPIEARAAPATLRDLTEEVLRQEAALREGGGPAGHERQRRLGRMPVRQRIAALLDPGSSLLELNLWAAHGMYEEWGPVPAAAVVTGIGPVAGRPCMVIANDATVKAGAFFPQTVKKVLRAQKIAGRCALPILYLVDSSGVFLPMQDEIFPDEDDFGRIFRNNAVLSAEGVPQYAAILGSCVAGGAYLPVLCDKVLMTEGSALYLAGPSLVKAAIGQAVDDETLGGAAMHAEVSGTIDFREPDDAACLARLRSLVALLPEERYGAPVPAGSVPPEKDPAELYDLVPPGGSGEYDARDLAAAITDGGSVIEYKAEYGRSLFTAYARIGGRAVGIVASQRVRTRSPREGIRIGGVIYGDGADKAARFVMDSNQTGIPIVFLQDVSGFMVGRDAERAGIIRSGAKLVNAVSNSIVPRITVIVGGSFGAGNYALCGKAFDPHFVFAWPGARYAVMGAAQAADTLLALERRRAESGGRSLSEDDMRRLRERVEGGYFRETDIRHGAARGWIDAIIPPDATRDVLIRALGCATRRSPAGPFRTGVLQV